MPQTPEAESFLNRIASLPKGPGVSLDQALQPSLDDEAALRRLFATDKTNARLNNPHVGLVDVFEAPTDIRTTRARIVKDDDDLAAKYVMPLSEANRRKEGSPAMVADLEEFKKNWSIFTENSLSQLFDWNNIVAAGGAVLASLSPLPDHAKVSKRAIRKHYHSAAYPSSDVDLFLWGLTPEEAEVKINTIYEAVRDSVPWDVTCVRTKHTVSIHSQYPYRSVQIVLRLYSSPAEVLAGFDIDAPCCAYDNQRVWANPRAIVAMMRQCNTVDVTRRSPSYEVRLAKYSSRAFEVYVPTLKRADIDPTIYERSIARIEGMARLLVLEKLATTDLRNTFLNARRTLRGRPKPLDRYTRRRRQRKGDLKADTSIGVLEMNDYDVASLHIPYGPGWDARRIDTLVYRTDLGMNSTFNPKNKGRRLHRHPAFFGTMQECLEDCCEHCPTPIDDDERKLQEKEDNLYIRGRISFIVEDPGRQSISGSFNPIDIGEWSGQVYIGLTEKFFTAIAAQDRAVVSAMIKAGSDVNRRDHVGRTPLHVAIFSKSTDIACDLIDAGARMTDRLVDGRTALHLASQLDQVVVVRKLLERSAINTEEVKGAKEDDEDDDKVIGESESDSERPSSEDDWSSEEDNGKGNPKEHEKVHKGEGKNEIADEQLKTLPATASIPIGDNGIPEDGSELPDIIDVDLPDWDFSFTPLSYAVLFASPPVVEALLTAGADPKLVTKPNGHNASVFHPLTLTILREDEDHASEIAERLLLAGATSSTADDKMCTIFHRAVSANRTKLVSTFLRCDPNANTVLNFPCLPWGSVNFPIITTLAKGNYSILALMLAHGVKYVFTEEDVTRAQAQAASPKRLPIYNAGGGNVMSQVYMPVETAIAHHDDVVQLLIALGAQLDLGIKTALDCHYSAAYRKSVLDWVRFGIQYISDQKETKQEESVAKSKSEPSNAPGWKGYHDNLLYAITVVEEEQARINRPAVKKQVPLRDLIETQEYLTETERILVSHGAKTWNEIYPDMPPADIPMPINQITTASNSPEELPKYFRFMSLYNQRVPRHETPLYDELYLACFTGDNEKIQQLCLPPQGFKAQSVPLQISVQTADPTNQYNSMGYTPLFAAFSGRQWQTARLVLTIASAQYRSVEKEEKFGTADISLDVDSDDESEGSGASDETVDQQAVNFIDIAKRPSAIHCDIHPRRILHDAAFKWPRETEAKIQYGNLLHKSVDDNDFEAFVNIANLYKTLPDPIDLGSNLFELIMNLDRPDMLDEYIRRTGLGVNITVPKKDGEDEISTSNDKNRVYFGLSVHGKKRMDLAKKNDPNVVQYQDNNVCPLVWKAALTGAHNIVDYLSGDRPLAAYRFYCAGNSDERATRLRRTPDLEKVLPEWLGWTISPLGESPLTAAVLGGNLDLAKKLFQKSPRLMALALHERIKSLGYNPLMLAIDKGCDPAFVDYLLAKSISPAETDQVRGWNIFHIMCSYGHHDLLQHLLRKLPKDVVEALLAQQSKGRLSTPLHIAVRTSNTRSIKLIVECSKAKMLARNVDGYTPLHSAVQRGYSEITKILVDASPAEALYMENGVGETPLEVATRQEIILRTHTHFKSTIEQPGTLTIDHASTDPNRFDLGTKEREIPRFRSTLDGLLHDGRLQKHTKLANELLTFADKMEEKLAAVKAAPKEPATVTNGDENKDKKDICNRKTTLEHVTDAMTTRVGLRRLVHLIDVQKSVQQSLPRSGKVMQRLPYLRGEDGLELEEVEEQIHYGRNWIHARVSERQPLVVIGQGVSGKRFRGMNPG